MIRLSGGREERGLNFCEERRKEQRDLLVELENYSEKGLKRGGGGEDSTPLSISEKRRGEVGKAGVLC